MYFFPNLEPVWCSLSGSVGSSPSYRFLRRQVRWLWSSHLFKNFPQFVLIHTVKGFSIVNEAEVDVFLEFSSFFYEPTDVSNLISDSSAFLKSSLYMWVFSFHILLKSSLENFEHCFASMWNKYSCVVVWTLFGIAFLWDWNENWPFPVLWLLLSFPNLLTYWAKELRNGYINAR